MNLFDLTAHQLKKLLLSRQITSKEVVLSIQQRAKQINTQTNAYIRFFDIDQEVNFLQEGALSLPIAFKDNICIKGKEVTCASKILKGFISPYDAFVTQKIKEHKCVVLGSLNMDEFAFGSSCETSSFGVVRNPWDLRCVPGGSSGGSAAAVASGQSLWALGSDTGGSIRQPASFCGIVGLKPTYGRVSRYGLIAFGSSLDQIGPLTKDVKDNVELFNMIAGFDPQDSTSLDVAVDGGLNVLGRDIKGLRIGIPKEYFLDGIQPDVLKAVNDVIAFLKKEGAEIKEVSLPHTSSAVSVYYILATAEASSNLARFDGVEYGRRDLPMQQRKTNIVDMYEETRAKGFSDEAKRRIMLGTYVLSSGYYDAYYLKAQKVRTLIKQDFDIVFKDCDVILSPTSPTTAFKIGEKLNDPLSMYLSDIFTIPANLAGIPAISIPCGFDQQQLPIGLQLMAKPFDEQMLFRIAYFYEQAHAWHQQRAKIS